MGPGFYDSCCLVGRPSSTSTTLMYSKALSKTLTPDDVFYLEKQFALLEPDKNNCINLESIRSALMKHETDAMRESRTPDIPTSLNVLKYRRMNFEEFSAPALNVHQMEALDQWEQYTLAYEIFEKDGNRAIVIEEVASELGVGPSVLVLSVIRDWIRPNDGKLSFLGFVKLLHGVSIRSIGSGK